MWHGEYLAFWIKIIISTGFSIKNFHWLGILDLVIKNTIRILVTNSFEADNPDSSAKNSNRWFWNISLNWIITGKCLLDSRKYF